MNTWLLSFDVVKMLGIISSMHHRDRRSLQETEEQESTCLETGLLLAKNKWQYSNTKLWGLQEKNTKPKRAKK